jgi:predicted Na+-dependent transporter
VPKGGGKTALPLNHILTNMKNKIKLIDKGMLFIFVLWLASTNFSNMNWLSIFTGVFVAAYLVFYAVRRMNKR